MTEFQESFGSAAIPDRASINTTQLSEACLVLDVLEPDVKLGFLEWFLDQQVQEYRAAFDQTRVRHCRNPRHASRACSRRSRLGSTSSTSATHTSRCAAQASSAAWHHALAEIPGGLPRGLR